MAGRQQNSTGCFIFTDHVRCGRGGKNGVSSHYEFSNTICRADFEDGLYGFWGEITAISTDYKSGAFDCDGVEDGLDKVFCIVLVKKNQSIFNVYELSKLPLAGKPSLYAL